MGMPAIAANLILLLLFNNSNFANLGDATGVRGSTVAGSLYVGLHTADPSGGNQTTSEASYTGYARVAVARSGVGWTVSGTTVTNAAIISFPTCTGSSSNVYFWSIGTDSSGTGTVLYSGPIGTNQGPFTAIAAGDLITIPGHALSVNDPVVFFVAPSSSLPTGITGGTVYFVKTVSGNDITISTTAGGSTLDITAAGDGVAYKATLTAVGSNVLPSIAAGGIVLTQAGG